jgi:hypothetical protein
MSSAASVNEPQAFQLARSRSTALRSRTTEARFGPVPLVTHAGWVGAFTA